MLKVKYFLESVQSVKRIPVYLSLIIVVLNVGPVDWDLGFKG